MIDSELRDMECKWTSLPGAMNGMRHLYIALTHGDGSVTKIWLTERQAAFVEQTYFERAEIAISEHGDGNG